MHNCIPSPRVSSPYNHGYHLSTSLIGHPSCLHRLNGTRSSNLLLSLGIHKRASYRVTDIDRMVVKFSPQEKKFAKNAECLCINGAGQKMFGFHCMVESEWICAEQFSPPQRVHDREKYNEVVLMDRTLIHICFRMAHSADLLHTRVTESSFVIRCGVSNQPCCSCYFWSPSKGLNSHRQQAANHEGPPVRSK